MLKVEKGVVESAIPTCGWKRWSIALEINGIDHYASAIIR